MSKLRKKTEVNIQKREYTKGEIERAIQEMDKLKIDGKFLIKSWMRWYQIRGAIKIYDIEKREFGVVLPNFTEMRELEDAVHYYERKNDTIEKTKVEELEKLANGMKIQ